MDAPLNTDIGPAEILVTQTNPILIADLTGVRRGDGLLSLVNLGGAASPQSNIFVAWHNSASSAPSLTTANGLPIAPNFLQTWDKCGGMALWGIVTTTQSAGFGTRITGMKFA